jgi:hypothetical protein
MKTATLCYHKWLCVFRGDPKKVVVTVIDGISWDGPNSIASVGKLGTTWGCELWGRSTFSVLFLRSGFVAHAI